MFDSSFGFRFCFKLIHWKGFATGEILICTLYNDTNMKKIPESLYFFQQEAKKTTTRPPYIVDTLEKDATKPPSRIYPEEGCY